MLTDDVAMLLSRIPRELLEFFASSVIEANDISPSRWGVTPKKTFLRLNVGWCEVLTIHENSARIFIDRASPPSHLPDGVELGDLSSDFYVTAPGSVLATFDLEQVFLTSTLAALRDSHNAIIASAARRSGFNGDSRVGHQNWLLDSISEKLKTNLPYPDYSAAARAIAPNSIQSVERRETTFMRLVRDTQIANLIKQLYQHECQVCNEALQLPQGLYAEGAHIRPLGSPHNGPDTESNILCLCSNHHVLFDGGAFSIADDFSLIGIAGSLTVRPTHKIDLEYIRYHRSLREQKLSDAYQAFNLEYAQHPERSVGLEPDGEGLEPSNGSEWLTSKSREA